MNKKIKSLFQSITLSLIGILKKETSTQEYKKYLENKYL